MTGLICARAGLRKSMYIYIYMYIYMYMYVCIYICMCVFVYICIEYRDITNAATDEGVPSATSQVCFFNLIYIHIYTYKYIHIYIFICI